MTSEGELMLYNKYKTWLKGMNTDDTDYKASDMRVKNYLTQMNRDDTIRKMLGLRMLQDGIIDKGLFDIMLLKNINNYF